MIRRLETGVGVLASAVLFVLMLITVVDVFGRAVLRSPLPGASELTEIAMVFMVFLIYPQIAAKGQHICIDLLDGFMNDAMRRVQMLLSNLLGGLMFAALSWRLWIFGDRAAVFGDRTGYLEFPISLVFWFMSIMSAVTTIAFLTRAAGAFRAGSSVPPPAATGALD